LNEDLLGQVLCFDAVAKHSENEREDATFEVVNQVVEGTFISRLKARYESLFIGFAPRHHGLILRKGAWSTVAGTKTQGGSNRMGERSPCGRGYLLKGRLSPSQIG
jgi:hypothetical protein